MREANAEREKALSPAARVSLSTHALCPSSKIAAILQAAKKRSGGKIVRKNKRWSNEKGIKLVLLVTETFERGASL